MNTKDIKNIIDILKDTDVTEFELEQDGTTIKISRKQDEQQVSYVAAPAVAPTVIQETIPAATVPTATATPVTAEAPVAENPNLIKVESPIVGTFYEKPSPDAPNFVTVGQKVKKGETLCIVEAMKLMNEIECDVSGKIVQVLVENGSPVEFNQPLFKIEKS